MQILYLLYNIFIFISTYQLFFKDSLRKCMSHVVSCILWHLAIYARNSP